MLTLTENAVVSYTTQNVVPEPLGNEHPFVRPYELFACKDEFVSFGGYTDKFWKISCEIFGEPGDADHPEVQSMGQRFTEDVYRSQVKPMVERWFAHRTKAELEELAGDLVPLSAVKDIGEVVSDPQIAVRDMVVDVEYDGYGALRTFGSPVKLDRTPPRSRGLAPEKGEHSDEVLRDFVGLAQREIDELRAAGTI